MSLSGKPQNAIIPTQTNDPMVYSKVILNKTT